MKTTYEKLFNYAMVAQTWLDGNKERANTKLGYAISRLSTRVQKAQQRYNEAIDDINIEDRKSVV